MHFCIKKQTAIQISFPHWLWTFPQLFTSVRRSSATARTIFVNVHPKIEFGKCIAVFIFCFFNTSRRRRKFLFWLPYIIGLSKRITHSPKRSVRLRLPLYCVVTSSHCKNSSSKSVFTSCTALQLQNQQPFSKCKYRLRKSRLIVPTVASSSSHTNCLACINPGVYS